MSTDRHAAGVRIGLLADERARQAAPAGLDGRVLSLVYEDTEKKADKLKIELDNRDLTLFEREDLLGGALLEVSWGYRGLMAPARRVVVQHVKGFEVLTLEAYAQSVLMHRVERTRRFEHQSASDLAIAIAREHGFEAAFARVEPTTTVYDLVSQAAETDAALLRRLANREGFVFYVDDTGLHFHPENVGAAPTHILGWRAPSDVHVLSISVESDFMRRVGRMSVRGRDPMSKSTDEGKANSDTAERGTLGEGVAVIDPETGALTLHVRNASEAVRTKGSAGASTEASRLFAAAERPTVKLSMQTVGDPSLRAKALVEVRGVPALMSGKYYVTEVKHTVNSAGYVCDLKLVRDALGLRAGSALRKQGGDRNRAQKRQDGPLTRVSTIDPETGRRAVEFRRDGRVLGGQDPEARLSHESNEPSMSGTSEMWSVTE